MALILLPTVELEPHHWAEPGYDARMDTPFWKEDWERSLSRWNVTPVAPGDWHVATDSLESEDALTRLLMLALKAQCVQGFHEPEDEITPDDEVSALCGGYALFEAARGIPALPTCCCDLGDLGAWRLAASLGDGDGLTLAIGHGNWSARREGAAVVITEHPEQRGFEPVTRTVSSSEELLAATHVAERALEAFRLRLRPVLRRLVADGSRTERLSSLLVGLPVR